MKEIIVAPIPVFGRLPLLSLTIQRLYDKNHVDQVICIGHEPEAKELCESLGAEWVQHDNQPLGAKWNAGFMAAKKYEPTGILFVGSSDWVSDDYVTDNKELLNEFDLIGKLGCYFADIGKEARLAYWPGYTDARRSGEPIGIGRLISARILEKMGWHPFNGQMNHSMDWSMWSKITRLNGQVQIIDSGKLLSISTDKWENKHNFVDCLNGKLPSQKENVLHLVNDFPELTQL